ncbi:MAG: hypothetical protein KDE54_15545, partial [Caldilineaceae bacterium]|nr:hypothetical protein [Caldilineaceae bacterium]
LNWLRTDYALDDNSAWLVVDYVAGQLDHAGAISSDRAVLVELFDDPLGDPRMVVQAPFGGRVNGLWGLALAGALRERLGVEVEVQSSDEGILFRFPDSADYAEAADFPIEIVSQIGPQEARELILRELPNSAVFGAQFRQNAARALLLPSIGRGKRTPFWLQRLRAKDLLQIVREFEDFPIVAETYRDCLEEVMDLPHLEQVLAAIQAGTIQVAAFESAAPSPVAQGLMWRFTEFYMYEWDAPKAERQLQTLALNRDLLQDILQDVDLSDLLRSEAVQAVHERLQHTAPTSQARTMQELAALFQQLGDLSSSEVAMRTTADAAGWIAQLAGSGRIVQMEIPTAAGSQTRWVDAELAGEYAAAFALDPEGAPRTEQGIPRGAWNEQSSPLTGEAGKRLTSDEARRQILNRYLSQVGPVTVQAIRVRYDFPAEWLAAELQRQVEARQLVHGRFTPTPEKDA